MKLSYRPCIPYGTHTVHAKNKDSTEGGTEREERYTPAVYEYIIVALIHRVVRRAYHNTYYGTHSTQHIKMRNGDAD